MSEIYVVGIDDSEGSIRAAQYAVDHASKTKAAVKILHVLEWSPYSFLTPEELEERHKLRRQELERAKSAIVDFLVNKIKTGDVSVEGDVRYGHVAESIHQYCGEINATHLYVGRHGGGGLSTRLFGSVPGALVQSAKIPVTVVP